MPLHFLVAVTSARHRLCESLSAVSEDNLVGPGPTRRFIQRFREAVGGLVDCSNEDRLDAQVFDLMAKEMDIVFEVFVSRSDADVFRDGDSGLVIDSYHGGSVENESQVSQDVPDELNLLACRGCCCVFCFG